MTERPVLRPDAMLCFNLYAASHAFTRFYKPLLDPLGLTYPQFLVMLALVQDDGRSVGQLSDDLAMETSTLSPLLKRLEGAGLLRRERSGADERRVFVHLTEAGQALGQKVLRVPGCVAETLDLPRDDIGRQTADLQDLRRALDRGA